MSTGPSAKRRRTQVEEEDEQDEEEEEEEEEVEQGESGSDDGDSEISLQVDEDGRVCSSEGPLTRSISFEPPVRVFDGFVSTERIGMLRDCCERCFKVKPSKGRYSSGKTFWSEWGQVPRCELEALALAILRRHCPEPAAAAGVEWWTLCLDTDAEVGWHWDRDYVLEDSGVNIHPMLSTVTYLSPTMQLPSTIALEVLSPPSRDAERLVSLPPSGGTATCTVVPPSPGRHLVFDGRFLHGAPRLEEDTATAHANIGARRVTFLANIWVGHKPGNASALPQELQVWPSSGEEKGEPSRIDFLSAAAVVVPPVEPATMRSPTECPLEGGKFQAEIPSKPKGDGRIAVVAASVAVSWKNGQTTTKSRNK